MRVLRKLMKNLERLWKGRKDDEWDCFQFHDELEKELGPRTEANKEEWNRRWDRKYPCPLTDETKERVAKLFNEKGDIDVDEHGELRVTMYAETPEEYDLLDTVSAMFGGKIEKVEQVDEEEEK